MKSFHRPESKRLIQAASVCLWLVLPPFWWTAPVPAIAQEAPKLSLQPGGPPAPPDNTATGANKDNVPKSEATSTNEIQVSFQGANIDIVVQWLAQTTGKSVIKHPQAQCQLTIVGSKKMTSREAITLVYRALSLEGFTAIESGNSILIVPEGKEPKMSPELLDAARTDTPGSRQRLVKVIQLRHVLPTEMKEKVKGILSDKGTVEINDRASQIIITDYNDSVVLAADLIKILDTDNPGDLAVRVIGLRHVGAQDLVKEIAPLYQKMSGKGGTDTIEVAANDRSNSLIILSSEANYEGIAKVVATLDTDDAQDKVMRAFPLKNADAEDVAKQLKDLTPDQDSFSRFRFYGFDSSASKNTKKMSVVADRRRNTIIVQAPPAQMQGIATMIAALDEPVGGENLAPRIYPLKYVSAVDIEDVLNELFLKKQPQRNYFYYYDDPPEPSADRDVGRLYGKVRITSEPHQNVIILTSNSAESLVAVEEVLKQLDVPSQAGESTLRVVLRFAKAAPVANSLNILFAKLGSPPLRQVAQPAQPGNAQPQQQQQLQSTPSQNNFGLEQETKEEGYFPWLGGQPENTRQGDGRTTARQVSDLVGRVRVVPDPRSNSLLVSANVHFFPQIMRLIEDLDAPTAQVLIEARIVEVASDFLDKLGVRWSPDGTKTFTADDYDNSFLIHSSGQYQKGFGGQTTVNTPSIASAIPQALTSLRSGMLDSTISMDFLIQFLRKNTGATVLAEPQINIKDNEVGKLFVGSQIPFIDKSLSTDVGGLNQTFSYKDVGIILEVIPHINTSGDVALKIRTESSAIQPGVTLFGGAILDTRNFKTEVTAKSGETLVLGGIIQKQLTDTMRKTPILGSIPGLGWAFKKKDKTEHQVELLVFLRPKVVRTPEEAQQLLDEVDKKAPHVKKWRDDIEYDRNNPKAETD